MRYRDGYKYQLKDLEIFKTSIRPPTDLVSDFIALSRDGDLYCNPGYAWDGATGYPDFESVLRPSLGHDALCQLMREGLLPAHWLQSVNLDFKCWVLVDGMLLANKCGFAPLRSAKRFAARAQAELVYLGVQKFGSSAADPAHKRPVLEAP